MSWSDYWSTYKAEFEARFGSQHVYYEENYMHMTKDCRRELRTLYYCATKVFVQSGENERYFGIILSKKLQKKVVVFSKPQEWGRLREIEYHWVEASASKLERVGPKMHLLLYGKKITYFVPDGSLCLFMQKVREFKLNVIARPFVRSGLEKLLRLWQKGFTHRDLKPDNILVDFAKQELLLIDFEMSRRYQEKKYTVSKGQLNVFTAPWDSDDESSYYVVDDRTVDSKGMGLSLLHLYTDILQFYNEIVSKNGCKHHEIRKIVPFLQEGLLQHKEELLGEILDRKVRDILEQMIYQPEKSDLESLAAAISSLES